MNSSIIYSKTQNMLTIVADIGDWLLDFFGVSSILFLFSKNDRHRWNNDSINDIAEAPKVSPRIPPTSPINMAIRFAEFSSAGYKIRKIFA